MSRFPRQHIFLIERPIEREPPSREPTLLKRARFLLPHPELLFLTLSRHFHSSNCIKLIFVQLLHKRSRLFINIDISSFDSVSRNSHIAIDGANAHANQLARQAVIRPLHSKPPCKILQIQIAVEGSDRKLWIDVLRAERNQ